MKIHYFYIKRCNIENFLACDVNDFNTHNVYILLQFALDTKQYKHAQCDTDDRQTN